MRARGDALVDMAPGHKWIGRPSAGQDLRVLTCQMGKQVVRSFPYVQSYARSAYYKVPASMSQTTRQALRGFRDHSLKLIYVSCLKIWSIAELGPVG